MSRRATLENCFPSLTNSGFEITSEPTVRYNCIAWAADDDQCWWEPDPALIYFRPSGLPREDTVSAYIAAFGTAGYHPCEHSIFETGLQKDAVFVKDRTPQHAARQLPDGHWTSKYGGLDDIAHDLRDLEGEDYGTADSFLARPLRVPTSHLRA